MHTWYYSVCDEHKEAMTFFVNTPTRTAQLLTKKDKEIYEFLSKHYGCNLRMIHHDLDMDKLWEGHYFVDGKQH